MSLLGTPAGTLHRLRLTFWLSGGHGGGTPSQAKRTNLFENCRGFLQAWQVWGWMGTTELAGQSAAAAAG